MNDRDQEFIDFLEAAIKVLPDKANGTLVSALADAWVKNNPAPEMPEVQDFGSPEFDEPVVVYVIRNHRNGMAYIGMSQDSFNERYPRGWWDGHHNPALARDVGVYGIGSFHVTVYKMANVAEAEAYEADKILLAGFRSYNKRREPVGGIGGVKEIPKQFAAGVKVAV